MARPNSPPDPEQTERPRMFPAALVIGLIAIGTLFWFLHSEADNMELKRSLRALPGGGRWLDEQNAWVGEGMRSDRRAIWLAGVDEIVRTKPEEGEPELLALKLVDAVRVSGSGDRRENLYVSARGFDFAGRGLDEPLTGHLWLVATFENEHGQRHLFAAMPAPIKG